MEGNRMPYLQICKGLLCGNETRPFGWCQQTAGNCSEKSYKKGKSP